MSKRVLFLVNHDVVIYNFRKELVERLLEEGYEVYISSPYGERIDELVDMGCHFEEVNLLNRHGTKIADELKLIKYYKNLITKIKPDIVLTYTIKPNIYGGLACKKLGIPYVANITGLGTAIENGGIIQRITVTLYRKALKNAQTVFFQNENNRKLFQDKKIAIGQHDSLPGSGVNLEQFEYLDYPTKEKIEFVFISRVMKQKGFDEFLEAAQYIKQEYPNTVFHVCGFVEDKDYEQKLLNSHNQGIIHYHGMIKNIKSILAHTHATIHPSYHEGMSNVLLESAASGRPLLASNVNGCKETFDEGLTGYGFKVKSSESLIKAIEKFINLSLEEKREMGELGREKMINEFDRNIIVKRYLEEIHKVEGSK